DRDVIRYSSKSYPSWTIRLGDVSLIGEATNQNGPFADDYFLCFATSPEGWYEASFYAENRDEFLAALGAQLGTTLRLELTFSTDFSSRILWPVEYADQPMFDFRDIPPKTVFGRFLNFLGFSKVEWHFSDAALAALTR
ncbi:MAG TPA: hypothetical protein VLA12_21620, partial [Planctomycetaceae bacterium]|nr:hypothetical protein [Planctomycetaceae bacterium]